MADSDFEPKVNLQRVVGLSLDHFYALVAVQVEEDVAQMRVLEWNGHRWDCIYKDPADFADDCAIMGDGSLIIARDDGALIFLNGALARNIDSRQTSGFSLMPVSDTTILMAGPYVSIYDTVTASTLLISTIKGDWSRISKHSDDIYLVGKKGRIATVDLDRKRYPLTFIPSETEEMLTAVCEYPKGGLVIGGWNGLVRRRFEGRWEDISMSRDSLVIDLTIRDSELVACDGGVCSFDEGKRTWRREIDRTEVWGLSTIDGHLLASHTYSGLLSLWDNGRWIVPFPSILDAPGLL